MFNKKKSKKEQEDKDIDLVSRIIKMYNDSSSAKMKYVDTWKENYKAYNGKLFERNSKRREAGNAIPNHIFATVETIKPIMFTNPPKNLVYPTSEDGFFKAMMVQEALDYEWRRTKLLDKTLKSLTSGLIYGTFIVGLFWDGKASRNMGEIKPVPISPFNFFIDPMATEIGDAEYCMYATYKPLGELIKQYPDKKDELIRNSTNNIDENLTFGNEVQNAKNQILFIECYFKDYATDTFEEEDEDGTNYMVSKLKYPNGRRVTIAGDVLLENEKNPYEDGRFPFVSWNCYDIPGDFWGMGEVEMLVSIQKEICSLYNDIIDNAHLNGNAPWIVDKNAGIEKNTITNSPGAVFRKNPGSEVRREQAPNMPAYIQNIINDLKYDIQVISGVFDATRGERPMSISSGVAIQALQDSSQGRIRLKTQKLENFLSELGSMWLCRMQQFWQLPRTIRIMGGEYSPDERPIIVNGQQVVFKEVYSDMIDGDFDIEIKTGSTMAVNKSAKFEQVIRMAQTQAEDGMPLIDRRVVLEYSELENVDDIIKRFEEQAQIQQQNAIEQQKQQTNLQMEQQQLNHAQDIENMQMNAQSQMETKKLDIEGKMALQLQQQDVQSNGEESKKEVEMVDLEKITIEELLKYIQSLSEEELNELLAKQPEIGEILASLEQLISEQSQDGQLPVENSGGVI